MQTKTGSSVRGAARLGAARPEEYGDDAGERPLRQLSPILLILVILTPLAQVLSILWLIWNRTPHVPWWDEWDRVVFVHRFDQGRIGLGDFLAFDNENRQVIPRLIDLPLIEFTNWNRQFMATFDFIIAVGTALLLFACVRRALRSTNAAIALIFPLALLFFSLSQYENWLWAYQVNFIVTVFGAALCLWALTIPRPGPRGFILALIGALIASLATFGGLLLWIAFLPSLWGAGYRRVQYYLLWVGCALGVIIPYLHGLPAQSSSSLSLTHAVGYLLAYLGAPVGTPGVFAHAPSVAPAELFAVASILLTLGNVVIFWLLRRDLKPVALWGGLALYALTVAAITALGRGGSNAIAQAFTSRYQAFSALWWVAVVVIAALVIKGSLERLPAAMTGRQRQLLGIAAVNVLFLAVACVGLIRVNIAGFQEGRDWMLLQRENEQCILYYDTASDACLGLYFVPQEIRARAPFLEADHLSIFRDEQPLHSLPRNPGMTESSIDVIGQVEVARPDHPLVVLPQGAPVAIRGWAVDTAATAPATAVFIAVDGTATTLANYGFDRPDLASMLRNPAYTQSGFLATLDTGKLSPGRHALSLQVINADQTSYYASTTDAEIEIVPLTGTGAPARLATDTRWSIDAVNGPLTAQPPTVSRGQPVTISGWAMDAASDTPPGAVFVFVDGMPAASATLGGDRPDVAAVFGDARYAQSGFSASIPTDALSPGPHRITFRILTADLRSYYQPMTDVTIDVRG